MYIFDEGNTVSAAGCIYGIFHTMSIMLPYKAWNLYEHTVTSQRSVRAAQNIVSTHSTCVENSVHFHDPDVFLMLLNLKQYKSLEEKSSVKKSKDQRKSAHK